VPSATTLVFLAVAALAAAYGFWAGGSALVLAGASQTVSQTLSVAPQIACGLLIGAFIGVLMPRELLLRWVGKESGLTGLAIATVAGAFMPGGPFAAFPVIHALHRAGAATSTVVAFLVAWSCIGVNRLLIWEIPFLGVDFGLLRIVCTLPLPILAGLAARALIRRYPALDAGWSKES